jgi:hypothetical protein
MNDNAQNGILLNLVAVLAMATLALAFLQSLGNTPIRGDHDLPPVASPRR